MKTTFIFSLLTVILLFHCTIVFAQEPPPPPPGGGHGGGGNQGGSAPLGSGIGILLALGAAYGSKKLYSLKAKEKVSWEELT